MNNKKSNAIISVILVPKIVHRISIYLSIDEISAINIFYASKTYEVLSNIDTGLWVYSELTLFNIWKDEYETGVMNYPEG